MTDSEFEAASAFEADLCEGSPVEVRWTNNHRPIRANAIVQRVNTKSVRVILEHDVTSGMSSWPAGQEIVVPLILNTAWTANNCVRARS